MGKLQKIHFKKHYGVLRKGVSLIVVFHCSVMIGVLTEIFEITSAPGILFFSVFSPEHVVRKNTLPRIIINIFIEKIVR